MKSSFKKSAATDAAPASSPAPDEKTNGQIVPRQSQIPTAVQHQGDQDMYGEWLPGDSKLPRLNVVQKMSGEELTENFAFGDLVFAQKVKLADAKTAVNVFAVIAGKDYQQKVPFGEGQGVVYRTAQEVLDNGGTLSWSKEAVADQIYFHPRAHIQFAIKAPAGLSESDLNFFPFEFGGDRYAMSIMTVASSAYTSLAKELETLRRHNTIMLKGLLFGALEMSTKKKTKPGQEWFCPVIKLVGENPPGLIEFLQTIK